MDSNFCRCRWSIQVCHIYIGTLSLGDDDPFVVLAAGNKSVLQISWIAHQARGKVVLMWNVRFAVNDSWKYIIGPEHSELISQCIPSRIMGIDGWICLPCNYNIQRLKGDMHTRTQSSAKTKAAELIVDKPGVGGFQESFRSEALALGKYLRILHNLPNHNLSVDELANESMVWAYGPLAYTDVPVGITIPL